MAGRIKDSDKEELKARVNIADVIGDFVKLKPAGGGSYKGLCPFHGEKSPSFQVTPSKQMFYCFGCQIGGDVFKFLELHEKMGFAESVEMLAARIGFQLSYEEGASRENGERARVLEANAATAEFFRAALGSDEAEPGRKLMKERGFDEAALELFGVGWAPKGWNNLADHLKLKGFTEQELLVAGLVSSGDRGVYDKFRGRVVWPIRDTTNQVIGFGARKIFEDDKGPKYLNSAETPVYHKSRVLYGLDLAKKDISKQQQVVVVEGYTDVMACHLAGVTTAIATCGTAFSEDHIQVLNRLLGSDPANPAQVIFNFDPDEAGQKAAMKAFGNSGKFNAQTFVAIGPDGLDPSDLRQQRGDEAVVAMIAAKRPLLEFAVDRSVMKFDLSSREGQVSATRAGAAILAGIADPIQRSVYVKYLSELTSVDRSAIEALVNEEVKKSRNAKVSAISLATPPIDEPEPEVQTGFEPVDLRDPTNRRERWLLEVVAQMPEFVDPVTRSRIFRIYFSASRHVAIAKLLQEELQRGVDGLVDRMVSRTAEQPELQQTFREIAMQQLPVGDDAGREAYAKGVLTSALEKTIELEKNYLLAARNRADAAGDTAMTAEIARKLVDLDRELLLIKSKRA
jgi:DNA primase